MKLILAGLSIFLALAAGARAQSSIAPPVSSQGSSLGSLIADGYEIKAAVPNGAKYIVFLQKGSAAYACEFVTLTQSRCGEIK